MESSISKMEKDGLYLLTIGQVLHNTKNILNVSLYYNRISIVNNLRRYENNYCWVHETKTNLQKFPENITCACSDIKFEEDSKQCHLRKSIKCPQELYVKNITNELNKKNLIVDFSSLQCISLIYKGRLYLYSNLSTCKLNPQTIGIYSEKESSRGIICEDCKTSEPIEFSREDIERALYDIIELGEDQKYGLTLMEHTSLGIPLHGLENVQDSVRSIGILEGSITDEPKESGIDKINVIDCDILLEDVNPPGSNAICCPSSQTACYNLKDQDCKGCKYINHLNDYLNTPIKNYNTKLNNGCRVHPKCDSHCDKCESVNHSSGKPETKGCFENRLNGCCEGNCACEKCECSGGHRADCASKSCCQASCQENLKHKAGIKKECSLGAKLGGDYLRECVKFANDLVQRSNNELESICSSLINQVNSMCQPPLRISIRFLEHFLCFEYLIEYNCDSSAGERDSLYGVSAMNNQNVILHEFIQSNVLTKQILEETFKLILSRISAYITPKSTEGQIGSVDDSNANLRKTTKESLNSPNNLKPGSSEKVDIKIFEGFGGKDRNGTKTEKEDNTNKINTNKEERKEEMMDLDVDVNRDTESSSPSFRQDSNVETPVGKAGLQLSDSMVNEYGIGKLSEDTDDTKLVDTPTTNAGSNDTTNGPNSRDGLDETPTSAGALGTPSTETNSGLNSSVNSLNSLNAKTSANTLDTGSFPNTITSLDNSSNLDELSNPNSSDYSYKNSYQDLDQVEKQENSSQELIQDKKSEESSDVDMDMDTYNEVYPYWWKFYVDDNTLGEGDVNARYEGIRRFTRSYLKEESSTPKNKKSGNGANYLLTRCVSSDFSTKSNINVSALHSSRETLCPSEFNQSQPASGQGLEVLPCFCKSCIPFISNITRMFPAHTSNLSNSLQTEFASSLEFGNLKEMLRSRTTSVLSSRVSSSPRISVSSPESVNRDSIESSSPSFRQDSTRSIEREEDIDHDFNIVNGLRRSLRAARDVATVIRKKLSKEHKPLLDTLNVALLSSLRLGEYLFNNPNVYSGSGSIEQMQLDNASNLDNRFDLFSEQINGFKGTSGDSPRSLSFRQESTRSIEREYQNGVGIKSTLKSQYDYFDKDNLSNKEGEEDVGAFLFLDVGVDNGMETGRSTFENDQYLAYDLVSEDDACSYSSLSSNSPKIFNKRKNINRSRRAYRSFSSLEGMPSGRRSFEGLPNNKRSFEALSSSRRSFEGLPCSRRSTRELPQDDMYIYDMNNLSDKGDFDDWYADSDSSKKSAKYVQKRMPPSRPSVSNLTEIYGSQDMLIPMGPLPIGVYFDASRKLWRCQWRENGKFRTKGFSLGHYNTLADARHACILFRCQVGNMNIQPEWLTPNYIKVSDLLNRRAAQPSSTPKKSNRKKKRHEDLYEPYP